MNEYFLTKIKYLKQSAEDGTIKSVIEEYVLNSLSFIEAETRLQTILEEYIAEYDLIKCDKMNIHGVVIDESKSNFFKVKVSFVSEDPDSGKGKAVNEVYYLLSLDLCPKPSGSVDTKLLSSLERLLGVLLGQINHG